MRLLDRLGGPPPRALSGPVVQGRYVLDGVGDHALMNGVPVGEGAYLVPDAGGRWALSAAGAALAEGSCPKAQALGDLDASSVLAVGHLLEEALRSGKSWLEVLDLSPLVPKMDERAEVQPLEREIAASLGHLEEVCARPRTHLHVEVERSAVSRARRLAPQAATFLAAHTEDWERPTLRSVIPKRILSLTRDDQFDIYENRIAVRLVDRLLAYLRWRTQEVRKLLGVFDEMARFSDEASAGSHWRRRRICSLWGHLLDVGESRRKADRTLATLVRLSQGVGGLMDSHLYRRVPRRAEVVGPLRMTNILSDDAHYRQVAALWLSWAQKGRRAAPTPREHLAGLQDLCAAFSRFALLLVIRALDQLGFEPVDADQPLSVGEIEVRQAALRVKVSWRGPAGIISLQGAGFAAVRLIPLASGLGGLEPRLFRDLVEEADAGAIAGAATVVLYPSAPPPRAAEAPVATPAGRLHLLPHEQAEDGERRRAGFLPVSPWDLGSVERMARLLRWSALAPAILSFPPRTPRTPAPSTPRGLAWLAEDGAGLAGVRPPELHEATDAGALLAEAEVVLRERSASLNETSSALRTARSGQAARDLAAKKRRLEQDVEDAGAQRAAAAAFDGAVRAAAAGLRQLLQCPVCGATAGARRDFSGSVDGHFTCTCPGCSAVWGKVACAWCHEWIPTLVPRLGAWPAGPSPAGWIDQLLGADVLAAPCPGGDGRVTCPSCGTCGCGASHAA